MPLYDHFHPPLSRRRHWHAFHNAWATYLSADLNRQLPPRYFAESNVQFGIEIDVATFDEGGPAPKPGTSWTPPSPSLTLSFAAATDIVEIQVFHDEGGPILAGAIELISPANKDRSAQREAFVSKCATYLQQGVGLILVDVVTGRSANLHDELLVQVQAAPAVSTGKELYAVSYRPVVRDDQPQLEVWPEGLAIGKVLPTLPLWLRGGLCLPVDLEVSYERTCQEQRVSFNGD